VGIDQDASALAIAEPRLAAACGGASLDVRLHNGNFRSAVTIRSAEHFIDESA